MMGPRPPAKKQLHRLCAKGLPAPGWAGAGAASSVRRSQGRWGGRGIEAGLSDNSWCSCDRQEEGGKGIYVTEKERNQIHVDMDRWKGVGERVEGWVGG